MNTLIRFFIAPAIAAACMVPASFAQQDAVVGRSGTVSIEPLYQRWNVRDSLTVSQGSAAVEMVFPAGRNLQLTFRSAPYSSDGGGGALSGLSDAQLGAAYSLEAARLAFSLGVSLPTGRQELTLDEFRTSLDVSNRLFRFRSPQSGQGVKMQPAVLWAAPISRDAVAGLGAAYQYRAPYSPIKGLGEYDPGDEIILTAGVDYSTGEASSIGLDAVYSHYGNDKFGGMELFRYGDRLTLNGQYRTAFGKNTFRVSLQYRVKADSDLWPTFDEYSAAAPPPGSPYAGYVISVQEVQEPDNMELAAYYGWTITKQTLLGFELHALYFVETDAPLSGVTLAGAALAPEFRIGRLTVPVRIGFSAGTFSRGGSLTGIEAGAGIRYVMY